LTWQARCLWAREQAAPIPDPQQLKQRAQASLAKSEKDLENYSCIAHWQTDELNADGSVKRHRSGVREQFFVNGVEIEHTLEKDGKPLAGAEAQREQTRVDKEVKKYSDAAQAAKVQREGEKEADMLLRALRFTHGQRETRGGRSTVVYALSGDPDFHPKNVEERFMRAVTGRIWVDEETGNPVELRVETTRDVKVAGGLLATVHKGFHLEVRQQRQPDGVWLTNFIEGQGDARAALFMHPRFRFKEELQGCRRFSVNTQQQVRVPENQSPESPR
jgi:hypothetical protein